LADSSLVARRVPSQPFALFAVPSYLRRRGRPRTLADLADHNCVLFGAKNGRAVWRLAGPSGDEKIEVSGRVAVADLLYAYTAAVAGLGIGLIPWFMAKRADRGLIRVLPRYSGGPVFLQIVSPTKQYDPARVALLRDYLAAGLGSIVAGTR
jgi:DNA-binding transcriptional LysR family regulator